ncbi:DNA mismatch repair endonuclease MutL [Taibaiella sp. KBW10]|uniref:DNA mismatch repair endonuclease MutL n=1 Tax=Taibaiella sp. KBW10 TaxID=2153357 RepID=UPI000F59ECB1|nr:DNA mismatch repair endonuclease MutL [Taibaiella sp. KBW10]RQO32607.1 DNA mismatch repair endonuclease MutL [Taibaiella sp. KBW10]
MPDIIQLLPDHLANQIAAGEVIQRPASAVKELLENAIDAGASSIHLVLKDAGKELIQVVDNGKGMSAIDARMSFERHATSKIKKIEDLFEIRTKGFRGEALASIAAVAQVVLKTKQTGDALGTLIEIEASSVTKQEPVACAEGTSFSIKNLFYNVPARRHFLKSNTTELKHVLDEFIRIAMAHPDIAFKFTHNNVEQFNLPVGNLKQRVLALIGNNIDRHLVPVEEQTDLLNITGFIGKPEAANRTRGNQYFFINNRFIKNAYLNHAVNSAFEGLIAKDAFPLYVLFLEIDPRKVDVNVHPTKQEVKFDDDKMMYAYLQAAIKYALNKFNVAPSIDFTLDPEIQHLSALQMPQTQARQAATSGYLFDKFSKGGQAHFIDKQEDRAAWKQQQKTFFPDMPSLGIPESIIPDERPVQAALMSTEVLDDVGYKAIIQWNDYLITTMKSGVVILHQKRALERIIYEKLASSLENKRHVSQQLLFPITVNFAPADALILEEILSDLFLLGYDIKPDTAHSFLIQGTPTDIPLGYETEVLEAIIEQLKHESDMVQNTKQLAIIKTMSKRMAIPRTMQKEQAQALIDELFACDQPQYAPDGSLIFRILHKESIESLL